MKKSQINRIFLKRCFRLLKNFTKMMFLPKVIKFFYKG